MPRSLRGLKVITSNSMVVEGTPYTLRKTFKEQFFSLPWRPLECWKTIKTFKPSPEVIIGEDNYLIMHPETKRLLYGKLTMDNIEGEGYDYTELRGEGL